MWCPCFGPRRIRPERFQPIEGVCKQTKCDKSNFDIYISLQRKRGDKKVLSSLQMTMEVDTTPKEKKKKSKKEKDVGQIQVRRATLETLGPT